MSARAAKPSLEARLAQAVALLDEPAARAALALGAPPRGDLITTAVVKARLERESPAERALALGVVEALGEAGARVEPVDCFGWSALHHAAIANLPGAFIRALARLGADLDARGHCGQTALSMAAERNCPESLAALMELGADPGVLDDHGRSPMDLALSEKSFAAAGALRAFEESRQMEQAIAPRPGAAGRPRLL